MSGMMLLQVETSRPPAVVLLLRQVEAGRPPPALLVRFQHFIFLLFTLPSLAAWVRHPGGLVDAKGWSLTKGQTGEG